MYFLRAFKVALTALAANKLRSVLAVLGIVIGVSAVIMMIGMGKGAQVKVEESITRMGVNLVFVQPAYRLQSREDDDGRDAFTRGRRHPLRAARRGPGGPRGAKDLSSQVHEQ